MTIRAYLLGMILSTVICFAAWSLVLIYMEPGFYGLLSFILFYFTLFSALAGVFTIIGFAVRAMRARNDNRLFPLVSRSFRQGFLFSIILLASLILQSQRMLDIINILAVVIAVSLIEIYFLHRYEREF